MCIRDLAFLFFFLILLPFELSTEDRLLPSHPFYNILFCHVNPLHVNYRSNYTQKKCNFKQSATLFHSFCKSFIDNKSL